MSNLFTSAHRPDTYARETAHARPNLFACDIVAVSLLVFGLYFPRHRRRDLVVALPRLNVGALTVTTSLSWSSVGAGSGWGCSGCCRSSGLRSTEIDHHEVAYYFSALALAILAPWAATRPGCRPS